MDRYAEAQGKNFVANPLLRRSVITATHLGLSLLGRGKVRDTYTYEPGLNGTLLMVSTDSMSAFDVVFNEGIPGKGVVLNKLSAFWFGNTKDIISNHLISTDLGRNLESLEGRAMLVKKAKPLKVEMIVRGHLTGSGFKEYKEKGTLWGNRLPEGLKDGAMLETPVFTPTTKAEEGHDMPMSMDEVKTLLGNKTAELVERKSIELYNFAYGLLLRKGLVLADTKFEFGLTPGGIILIDEALTPDSSRYWLKEDYDKGRLLSMDKQFLRDYLETTDWNKKPPPPPLPEHIITKTAERYQMAYEMITA
jgi:phosphoribosylaminoimidazole-succinocarboxamide synthase